MMNLNQFLKSVDKTAATMTKETLTQKNQVGAEQKTSSLLMLRNHCRRRGRKTVHTRGSGNLL